MSKSSLDTTHATPAELLRITLRALRMKQVDLCRRTGLSPKHVNQLAMGAVGMTPDLALVLERATGILAERWMEAELDRRRIQGHTVALRSQLTCAAVHALRAIDPDGGADVVASVAMTVMTAMERLLEDLGIPVWDGVMSQCVSGCGSPASGESTSE